jgi:hypothetical protein
LQLNDLCCIKAQIVPRKDLLVDIHFHHSESVYTDRGTLVGKRSVHPNKHQALTLVKEALRQSPADYAFLVDFMVPLAVFQKKDDCIHLVAAEVASGSVSKIAHAFLDRFKTYQEGNAWADSVLNQPGVSMAIITSHQGIVAAFERGPGHELALIACGDNMGTRDLAV